MTDAPPDFWQPYLRPNERLLWQGTPLLGARNKRRLIALAAFGLLFLGAGLFGIVAAVREAFWLGRPLFGAFMAAIAAVMTLIGYTLIFGQWLGAVRAHRTHAYALSDRAAYIAVTERRRRVSVHPILPGTAIELDEGEGHDDLWFHTRRERDSDESPITERIGFEGIADGRTPFGLIRQIQAGTP